MRKLFIAVAFLCTLCLFTPAHAAPSKKLIQNDGIYPPADAAKSSIDFDNKGFIIDGKRTYLASGSIHYPRVPHELWADRLTRMKQASFNAVQTYAFWNLHEPMKDQWDFSGDADIEGFLDTAKKIGLYATVRPGPYVCAEWDSGGFPVWLKFVPNLTAIRGDNPLWLSLNDHWYDKILPLIARHQINHGGNVILVQLENEHPHGWGVLPDDPYFVHLHDAAVKDGIEVPHFMSGMHHGGSPSPDDLDPAKRTTPWISTEFWSGWFDAYRTMNARKFRDIVAANWNIMAHGGAGQNYYMIHGGSNFGTWCDDSTGASYDYGAAIGQAGDLRPIYYQMKRANQLAQSFPDIISNNTDALASYQDFATGPGVSVNGARQSDAGTVVFLRNRMQGDTVATFKTGETLRMTRSSNYPLPQNAALSHELKIVDTTAPVLAVAHNDHVITVIVYNQPGDTGRLTLAAAGRVTAGKSSSAFSVDLSNPDHLNLKIHFPASGVEECDLAEEDSQIRVLAINQDLSLYTWIVGAAQKQDVVIGPEYVQRVEHDSDGKVAVVIERPYGQAACGQVAVYGAKDQSWHLRASADVTIESQLAPQLANWRMIPTIEASTDYDDSKWLQSEAAQQMGADGDSSAFAWYRTTIDLPAAGSGTLRLKGADNLEVYVNGQHVAEKHGWKADFVAGKNTLAVFTSHKGRPKAYSYLGPLDTYEPKGIYGPTELEINGQTVPLKGWKLKGGPGADIAALTAWTEPSETHDVPTFYQAVFNTKPPRDLGAHPILRVNYKGLTRGMIWVNGHSLGRYPEKIRIDSLYIPECWLKDGENTLTIFDETGASPQEAGLVVEQLTSREVSRADDPVDPATPMIVPAENKVIDLKALNKGNLAFGCPVTASYTRTPGSPAVVDPIAAAVTDGDPETDWSPPSSRVASASVQIDLGKAVEIKTCEILFDWAANSYKYDLEGSTDGQSWAKLGDQSTAVPTSPDSPSQLTRLNLSGDACRYLRMTIHGGRNFTICEVRAFGDMR